MSRNIDIDRLNNVRSEPHGKLAGELDAKSTMLSVMFKVRVRTFFNIDSGDREYEERPWGYIPKHAGGVLAPD